MKSRIPQTVVAKTLAVLAVLLASACGGSTIVDSPLAIATVDVSPSSGLNLTVGGSGQLTATPKGSHGEPMTARAVNWESANNGVATVSPSGQVTAVTAGNTQITATSGGVKSSSIPVVVTAAARIGLSRTTVSFDALAGAVGPASQTVAITNSGTGTLSGLNVGAIQYTGQPTGWLTASLTGSTAPSTLTLTAAGGLAAGTYTAIVPINSVTSANSPQNVTVTYVVNPSFGLTISGTGTGTGTVTVDANVCTITNGSASGSCSLRAPSGATVTLTAAATGSSAFSGWSGACSGTSACVLTMSADRAVTAAFNPAPQTVMALTATLVAFSVAQGGSNPAVQTVAISNGGAAPLTGLAVSAPQYTSGQPSNWLSVSLSSSTAPANLDFQPLVSGLAPGTYTATVNVTSPVASNGPRAITITLAVVAKPVVFTAAATSVTTFSALLNGSVAQDGQPYSIAFEYGTSSTLTTFSSTAASTGPPTGCPGTSTCGWSFTLAGLASGTTYYYRVVATNLGGITRGSIISFKTF